MLFDRALRGVAGTLNVDVGTATGGFLTEEEAEEIRLVAEGLAGVADTDRATLVGREICCRSLCSVYALDLTVGSSRPEGDLPALP